MEDRKETMSGSNRTKEISNYSARVEEGSNVKSIEVRFRRTTSDSAGTLALFGDD